eukprot:scaffold345_cov134-Cylindrotheca_fusiformis.AAC.16
MNFRRFLLLLAVISRSRVVAKKFEIASTAKAIGDKIPEKSWAVVGYESFHGERLPVERKTKSARTAANPPTSPSKRSESPDDSSDDAPSGTKKAMFGVGLAAAAAAVGSSILVSQPKPERALVEAVNRPVAVRPMVVEKPKRTRHEGGTISGDVRNRFNSFVGVGASSLRAVGRPRKPKLEGATIPSEVINLVKSIVGVGVLSLPAGVAAFGSAPSAFIPAALLMTVIGVLSGYGFSLIGKVCDYTGARSYREAWSMTVGEESSWIPAWTTTCKTFLACLAFSMVLADTFSSLFETSRNGTLVTLTLLVLTPLCLIRNLRSLAPFSLLGVLGLVYTAMAMAIRWLDGSYSMNGEEPGVLVSELARHLRPKFGNLGVGSVLSSNALILVCMLSTAYMAHFNAPKFYLELRNRSVKRFNTVVSWGFGISIVLMGFMTMVGFLTFGRGCDGLVLNNYASSDVLMGFSRIAVALSLVFSYPLAFTGCRDGFFDLAQVPMKDRSTGLWNVVTVALLSGITYLATTLTDVSFVLAFGGATLGNALTYIFPAMMYWAAVKQQDRKNEGLGVFVAMLSACLGIVMGLIGASMALKSLD